jgi:hypothetical protein
MAATGVRPVLAALAFIFCLPAHAGECRVMDPELQGTYEGGCRNGLAEGEGVAAGEAQYRGGFRAGLKDGQGVKTWTWGDRYEGGFAADRRQGRGVYIWGAQSPWAGERYEGEYVADQRDGWGVYYWPNGDRFEGVWKADVRQGPSAMEGRREAAVRARAEAIVAGAKVCAWGKVGIAHRVLRVGEVEEVSGTQVQVRLIRVEGVAQVVESAGPQPGEVLPGSLSDWTPCL